VKEEAEEEEEEAEVVLVSIYASIRAIEWVVIRVLVVIGCVCRSWQKRRRLSLQLLPLDGSIKRGERRGGRRGGSLKL
jgi:hypothetical protein